MPNSKVNKGRGRQPEPEGQQGCQCGWTGVKGEGNGNSGQWGSQKARQTVRAVTLTLKEPLGRWEHGVDIT